MTPSHARRRPSRRVRRNRSLAVVGAVVVVALLSVVVTHGGGSSGNPAQPSTTLRSTTTSAPHAPGTGNGQAITLAFAGDVNFPAGSLLAARLASAPSSALGAGVPALLRGADLSMVNFESALTSGGCPDPQAKAYHFYAGALALQAFEGAGISMVTEANNHGEDCGPAGLAQGLSILSHSTYRVLGVGATAAQAFGPTIVDLRGEKVAIIAATDVLDTNLAATWTATAHTPGLASAYDLGDLLAAVHRARALADTVVVYLHWGQELESCPIARQSTLAAQLAAAGADVIIGTHAHVLLGAGYLGHTFVDYGLGNFAFYNTPPPTDQTGVVAITVTGRKIDAVQWRPALVEGELPVPLGGASAAAAVANWRALRGCTGLAAAPAATSASS